MPRAARIKDPTAVYHTMSRSISEFDLFPDNSDKECFLDLIKKYKEKFHCKIYGYCLMSSHYHLIIDTCGYDISKFMKSLNQSYVKYVNKKYNRRGHLLTERFNSKIIDTTEYMLTVSAYVHNNPKDLEGYSGKEFEYPYSSMGIYIGKQRDKRNLVDTEFVLGCVNENDRNRAIKAYTEMVIERRDIGINKKLIEYLEEFRKEQLEYKPYREVKIRDKKPEEVIKIIAEKLGIENMSEIMHRWKRGTMEFRRVAAYALSTFCGMGIKEVSRYMYNISASCCARLSDEGFEAMCNNDEIRSLLLELSE
jgi:REP element-mobilizing transposase RayT